MTGKEKVNKLLITEEIEKSISTVYNEISKGKLSYITYKADVMLNELEENFYDKAIVNDDLKSIFESGLEPKDMVELIKNYFNL